MGTKEMLSVHLAEMKFLNDQMHTRMGTVARLVTVSATFFTAMFAAFALRTDEIAKATGAAYSLLALAPVPFLILVLLIFREQLLMVSHDHYFLYRLRPAILSAANDDDKKYSDDRQDLGFLWSMSSLKIGGVSAILSIFIYTFPLLGMVSIAYVSYLRYKFGLNFLFPALMSVGCIFTLLIALYLIGKYKSRADAAP